MPKIDINVVGYGVAPVSNYDPVDGETVVLDCIPDSGEILLDIEAWDSQGYSVALAVQLTQSFTWTDAYGSMTIKVTFSPRIRITINGEGRAWVSNENPVTGETVTLYARNELKSILSDIQAYDENGNPVYLATAYNQDFTWQYQTLDIIVTFVYYGGGKKRHMPIWMYPILRH